MIDLTIWFDPILIIWHCKAHNMKIYVLVSSLFVYQLCSLITIEKKQKMIMLKSCTLNLVYWVMTGSKIFQSILVATKFWALGKKIQVFSQNLFNYKKKVMFEEKEIDHIIFKTDRFSAIFFFSWRTKIAKTRLSFKMKSLSERGRIG